MPSPHTRSRTPLHDRGSTARDDSPSSNVAVRRRAFDTRSRRRRLPRYQGPRALDAVRGGDTELRRRGRRTRPAHRLRERDDRRPAALPSFALERRSRSISARHVRDVAPGADRHRLAPLSVSSRSRAGSTSSSSRFDTRVSLEAAGRVHVICSAMWLLILDPPACAHFSSRFTLSAYGFRAGGTSTMTERATASRAVAASRTCSIGLSMLFVQVRAGRLYFVVSRAWARRRCWSTWSSTRWAAVWCARSASSRRWSLRLPGYISCCAPMLDRLERLPAPQRDALQTAFGVSSGRRRTGLSSGWRC